MAEENTEQPQTTTQPEAQEEKKQLPQQFEIPVLPLQNTTLFPGTVVPLAVGRQRSIQAVESALSTEEKLLCCITARSEDVTGNDAVPANLFEVGTLVNIKRMMRADDAMQLIVQGVDRVRVISWTQEQPFLKAQVQIMPPLKVEDAEEVEALKRNVQGMIQRALAMLPQVPQEIRSAVMVATDPEQIAYFLGSVMDLGVEQEQKMLEAASVDELLRLAYQSLSREVGIMQIRTKIANEAQTEMDKSQRDYVLRQQMKAIQKELGDDEDGEKAEAAQLARTAGKGRLAGRCRTRKPSAS